MQCDIQYINTQKSKITRKEYKTLRDSTSYSRPDGRTYRVTTSSEWASPNKQSIITH